MTYYEIRLAAEGDERQEVLIALLEAEGYEGFAQQPGELWAYVPAPLFDGGALAALAEAHGAQVFAAAPLPDQNWNAAWEAAYEPIAIGGFVLIHAEHHDPAALGRFEHTVCIQPQMSFGTGHHATTRLMLGALRALPLAGARVLDIGCGTGVLGIVAALLGAARVDFVDIDEWAVANTRENLARNGLAASVRQGGAEGLPARGYEVILANINRNVLLADAPAYAAALAPGSHLAISGFFDFDAPVLRERLVPLGFQAREAWQEGGWECQLWQLGSGA